MKQETKLTSASIRYLLALSDLCAGERGARCTELAARLGGATPSDHALVRSLCEAGLAETERDGAVFLTPEGRELAARYAACYEPLWRRFTGELGLTEETSRAAACAVLAQAPEQLGTLAERLA